MSKKNLKYFNRIFHNIPLFPYTRFPLFPISLFPNFPYTRLTLFPYTLFLIPLFLLSNFLNAQSLQKIDSLLLIISNNTNDDTLKVKSLLELSEEYQTKNPDSSIILVRKAQEISKKINYQKGLAFSHLQLGIALKNKGEYPTALDNYLSSVKLMNEINDLPGIARCYNTIGNIYFNQRVYSKALTFYLDALKIYDKIKMEKEKANIFNNIGNIMLDIKNYDKAFKYYLNAISTFNKYGGNKKNVAKYISNIGVLYELQNDMEKAIQYYYYSLNLSFKIDNKNEIANGFNHLGTLFFKQKNYTKALNYNETAMRIFQQIGDKKGLILCNLNAAQIMFQLEKYQESFNYYNQLFSLMNETENYSYNADYYYGISEIYSRKKDYKNAYLFHQKFINASDSISKLKNVQNITQLDINYNFEKQLLNNDLLQKKKEAILIIDLKKQKILIRSFIVGFLLMILILFFFFRNYRIKKKANDLLESQKNAIEIQANSLEKTYQALTVKNLQITDSINYAQLIQKAVLPAEKIIKTVFPDLFIINKPKEIVSGDFYWFHSINENSKQIICVADCSGHGVSGALMSLIGYTLLNETVKEKKICNPAEILDVFNEKLITLLSKNDLIRGEGINLTVCSIDLGKKELILSSAKQRTFLYQNKNIRIIDGSKYPIGTMLPENFKTEFPEHKFCIDQGTTIYLGTDGIQNQYNIENTQKFGKSNFENLIQQISEMDIKDQPEIVQNAISKWQGRASQTDDLLMIGIKFVFAICFLLFSFFAISGNEKKIDSLLKVRETCKTDTERINTLLRLCNEYQHIDFYKATRFANEALLIAKRINNQAGIANSLNTIGIANKNKGDFFEAIEKYSKALEIFETIKDTVGQTNVITNIATIYAYQGNNSKATEYFYKALALAEKSKNYKGQSNAHNNMGILYMNQKKYNTALLCYLRSFQITTKYVHDKKSISNCLNNIGDVYSNQGYYNLALEYSLKSLKIKKEIGNKKGIATTLLNIGSIYFNKKKYSNAEDYYNQSIAIYQELGDKRGIMSCYINKGFLLIEQKKMIEAIEYFNTSMKILANMGSLNDTKLCYSGLALAYAGNNDFEKAYQNSVLFKQINDSIFNSDNTQKITQLELNYTNNKQILEKEYGQRHIDSIKSQELQKQKLLRNILITAFILMIILAFIIYRNYRNKRKSNILLSARKNEISLQTKQLIIVNKELELSNQQITNSINYAKLIQDTIFPSEQTIKNVFPESFILFLPRDIVSGDFYWFYEENEFVFIAVADCTGHGASGAFMSMIGNALLNDIIKDKKIFLPSAILEKLNDEINSILSNEGEIQDDGMDITLCRIDKIKKEICFASANQSVYVFTDNKFHVVDGDNYLIGGYFSMKFKIGFHNHIFPFSDDTFMYMSTDGFQDQFDTEQKNKFGSSQLECLFREIISMPAPSQFEIIKNKFEAWKKDTKQTDDVLLMGIKFNMDSQ